MKKYLLTTLCLLVAYLCWAQTDADDIVKVGDTMPSFVITHDDGTKLASTQWKGKVILVNLFATWCPPCQKELAAVKQTLWPKYKDNKDFMMLVVGREHTDADLKKYNEKKGFEFPLYPDKNRAIFNSFAKNLIPRFYLIDKTGKVVYASKGYDDEEFNRLMQAIDKAIKE